MRLLRLNNASRTFIPENTNVFRVAERIATMTEAERMAPVDTTWLRMDRPANPMVNNGVLIFGGPLKLDRLEATLAERILAIRRFRQRVEVRSGDYFWREDPALDVRKHIKRVRLPGKGGRAELENYISDLISEPLDKTRPLWQIRIVEHYEGGAALVVRTHHAMADGIALMGVLLSVMDDGGSGPPWTFGVSKSDAHQRRWLSIPGAATLREALELTSDVLQEAAQLAASPAKTVRAGAGIAGELAHLLLMPQDSHTRFKGKPGGDKRVAWADPVALPEVKAVSKSLGCSINDLLLASVAGALGHYLRDKGDPTEGVEIRAVVPVNMRTAEEEGQLGNRFGLVGVELPVGIENPLLRLEEVRRRMTELKESFEPPVTLALYAALGFAPKVVQDRLFNLLTSRATAVMTNVMGPQHPLYLAGAPLKQVIVWVPQTGDIGMGVSILSFNGMIQFGLMTDAALVPDPEAIIKYFKPEFEQLLYFALMGPWEAEAAKKSDRTKRGGAASSREKRRSNRYGTVLAEKLSGGRARRSGHP
jgi:diacylglycerol O-acyltransferase / wax synthase